MAYDSSTPLCFARRALLSVALPLVGGGCTVITPVDTTIGDSAATDSDTDPTDGTDGTGTGGEVDVDCDLVGAVADVVVTWGLDKEICETEEGCDATRTAPCTVAAIDGAGPIVIDLACDDPDLGPSEDSLSVTLAGYGAIDLEVGAAVTLAQRVTFGFETHGGSSVRLVDGEGQLVLAALYLNRYGATSGDTNWQEDFLLSEITPLGGAVEQSACGGTRRAVQIVDGDAAIWLPSGGDGVLVGPSRWQIAVEEAEKSQEYDDGTIDVAVMRIKGSAAGS